MDARSTIFYWNDRMGSNESVIGPSQNKQYSKNEVQMMGKWRKILGKKYVQNIVKF